MVISSELKVNDLANINSQVACNSVEEGDEVLLLDVEDIFFTFWESDDAIAHQLVHALGSQDRLQMRLFVWIEFTRPIQMDAQTWDAHHSVLGVPELARNFIWAFLYHHLSGETKISIEPRSPQTAAIHLHSQLLASELVINFSVWS